MYALYSVHPAMGAAASRCLEGGMVEITCPFLLTEGPVGVLVHVLACNAPKMTLRQICRMLRIMRQLRIKEAAAAAAAARKQGSPAVTPKSPTVKSERRCLPACFRRRRSNNIKRVS